MSHQVLFSDSVRCEGVRIFSNKLKLVSLGVALEYRRKIKVKTNNTLIDRKKGNGYRRKLT